MRQQLKLSYVSAAGASEVVMAKLLDVTDGGWGIETAQPLESGTLVSFSGESLEKGTAEESCVRACVVWCQGQAPAYRVGLRRIAQQPDSSPAEPERASSNLDYYEILQLSPNADIETVHRVYRLLVGDAEKRAAYDVGYSAARRLRWKIFDQPKADQGIEGEKRKRKGILSLLYTKRLRQPNQPVMTLVEMEDLLGVPREHLEFTMWYLKEQGYVVRGDNGRFSITVKGVDQVEQDCPIPVPQDRLLPEARLSEAASDPHSVTSHPDTAAA